VSDRAVAGRRREVPAVPREELEEEPDDERVRRDRGERGDDRRPVDPGTRPGRGEGAQRHRDEQPQELVAAELAVRAQQQERVLRPGRRRGVLERRRVVVAELGRVGDDGERTDRPERGADRVWEEVVRAVTEQALGKRRPREDREQEQEEHAPGDDRDPVAAKPPPRDLPVSGRPRDGTGEDLSGVDRGQGRPTITRAAARAPSPG
jgi:hypothetical protein